jgi:hypothetical protein
VSGTLEEATDVWRWRIPAGLRLTGSGIACTVETAPNTGSVQVDVRAGASLLSIYTSGGEPEIESGETTTLTSASPGTLAADPTDLAAGTLLSIDIDSVGAVSPGATLLCALRGYEL